VKLNTLSIALVLSAATFITGCGNVFAPPDNKYASPKSFYYNPNEASPATAGDPEGLKSNFVCSGEETIHPEYNDISYNTSIHDFEVCPHQDKNMTHMILLQGDFSLSRTLCVFPAKEAISGALSYFPDAARNNNPLFVCSTDADQLDLAMYSFPSLQGVAGFNAVYMVEPNDTAQMQTCLKNQLQGCPFYYYGKFSRRKDYSGMQQ
jgi:hypothetical protein